MKKIIKVLSYILLFTTINYSCSQSKTDKNVVLGRLNIPSKLTNYKPFKNYLLDSVEIASSKLKIYFSIDFSCPSCIVKIEQWQSLVKNDLPKDVPVILICHSDDNFEYMHYVCENGNINAFQYPFFLDTERSFIENLVISKSTGNDAVLTDQLNNIILTGNLLASKELKETFIAKIKELNK